MSRLEEFPRVQETLDRLRVALSRKYVVDRELGRGGMATVYVAFDKRHNRQVAIKVFPPALAAAIGPERFRREIEITSRLAHPHILPLYDSGVAAGALYYVMPLVKGESLGARLERNQNGLPLSEVLSLADQISGALDYAHEMGVIHRDVTPDNVLLADSHALLADFGIARLVEGETLTESGMPLGTAMYRSPEQAAGHSKVDAASDIYSLGCVLYESLGGKAARQVLSNRFAAPVAPLRKLRPDIPASTEVAIARAMMIDPAERFASAGELAAALTRQPPIRRRLKRFRVPAAIAAVALAVVAAGFAFVRQSETRLVRTRVLVGRFVNRTGDKSLDPLGEMAGDYIARGLAETRLLEVIDSRFAFSRDAAKLGAGTVVQGSYYRTGNNLHFETQIIDTRSGRLVAFTPPADGSISHRTELIENLRQHLMGSFGALYGEGFDAWQGATLPPSYEAYQEILAGNAAVWQLDNATAVAHYKRASAMDTSYDGVRTQIALAASLQRDCRVVDSIAAMLGSRQSAFGPLDRGRLEYSIASCRGNGARAFAAAKRVITAAPRSISFSVLLAAEAIEQFRPKEALDVLDRVSPDEMQFSAAQRSLRTDFLALAWHELGDHNAELNVIREGRRALPADAHLQTDEDLICDHRRCYQPLT